VSPKILGGNLCSSEDPGKGRMDVGGGKKRGTPYRMVVITPRLDPSEGEKETINFQHLETRPTEGNEI